MTCKMLQTKFVKIISTKARTKVFTRKSIFIYNDHVCQRCVRITLAPLNKSRSMRGDISFFPFAAYDRFHGADGLASALERYARSPAHLCLVLAMGRTCPHQIRSSLRTPRTVSRGLQDPAFRVTCNSGQTVREKVNVRWFVMRKMGYTLEPGSAHSYSRTQESTVARTETEYGRSTPLDVTSQYIIRSAI